jgi:hypothetical protein
LFFWFYARRPASAKETTTRQAKSSIAKKRKEQFPKTKFTLRANHAGCCDPFLWIEWLNDPQEDEILAITDPLSNGVRIHAERKELCDICGAETIACLRGKTTEGESTDGPLVCLDCEMFGRWARFKQSSKSEQLR